MPEPDSSPSSAEADAEPLDASGGTHAVAGAAPAVRSDGSLLWRLGGVVRTIRPHQWVKNVFVLAPIVFAKEIFARELLVRAASAFAVFCLLAGAVYAINDIVDVEADRVHPVKRYRPIAAGRVPLLWAQVLAVGLVLGSLAWAVELKPEFALVAASYFALNLAYSFRLKRVAYLDVACISAGFVLRVVSGGLATGIMVSTYLLLCTLLLALFLGFGKRRHELEVAAGRAAQQRSALQSYSKAGLDLALWVTGATTIASYLSYTLNARTRAFFRTDYLWVSTLFVLLGVLRFVTLVRSRPKAESPTQEMLRDGPFVAIVLSWVALVMWVIYNLGPGRA